MSLTVDLSIDPTSAAPTAASFSATVTFLFTGPAPTGTLTAYVNGSAVTTPTPITDTSQTFGIALTNPSAPGPYAVKVVYSGDTNWPGPVDSNTETFTVTGSGEVVAQASARALCSFTVGADPSRVDRENGVLAAEGYTVTGISMTESGGGQYDAFTVAKLVGKVGGAFTAQSLTVTLDDSGGIASLAGYTSGTIWDAVPRVVITRWDGSGPTANFLGY